MFYRTALQLSSEVLRVSFPYLSTQLKPVKLLNFLAVVLLSVLLDLLLKNVAASVFIPCDDFVVNDAFNAFFRQLVQ